MPHSRSTARQPSERRSQSDHGTAEAAGHAAGGRDRRASRRVTLRAPLAVRWAGEESLAKIRILDISRTGFRFECSRIYSIGNHGHADSIKPEGTRIESDFVVVWTREMKPGLYQYGARFVKSASLRRSA